MRQVDHGPRAALGGIPDQPALLYAKKNIINSHYSQLCSHIILGLSDDVAGQSGMWFSYKHKPSFDLYFKKPELNQGGMICLLLLFHRVIMELITCII